MQGERADVWVARLADHAAHETELDALLTFEERAEVARHREDRAMARLSRGLLRVLLAGHLGVPVDAVDLDRTCPDCPRQHGRPLLRPSSAAPPVTFSVLHTADLLIIAVTSGGRIGVDVERVDDRLVPAELLDLTLAPDEQDHFAAGDAEGFLRTWTGKEAALKAYGVGLAVSPRAVTLPDDFQDGPATLDLPGHAGAALWVRRLALDPPYVGALATDHPVREVQIHRAAPGDLLPPHGRVVRR